MNIQDEIWAPFPIKGYPDYEVSNYGRVLSKKKSKHKILKLRPHHKGYFKVTPYADYPQKNYFIHRVVALAFIPNPNKLPQINHIDCDKTNNHVSNLEWCDNTHNQRHAKANGLSRCLVGSENKASKITESDVRSIRDKFNNGYTAKMLGEEYGITAYTVYDVVHRRTWRHI